MTAVRMSCRSRPCRWSGAIFGTLLSVLASGAVCRAAAPMILNHDDANRLIGATSAGSGAQFTYDANGNVASIAAASVGTLTFGATQTGQVNVGGAAALFSFTTTTNQPALSLDLVSANMSPAGSPVQVDVYNASGTLLGSTIGAAGTLLDLPPLPAGSYTVVVDAQNESTGSFQMELINTPVGAPSDGPLPPWTYLVLGAGLLAMLVRRERALGRMV
jgi:YD repeat-containing protein